MCAKAQESIFYSTYDVRDLVKKRKYKGLDFDLGGGGDQFILEDQDAGTEKIRANTYGCRIQTTGDDPFSASDFLEWLRRETIEQLESQKGAVLRQRNRLGRRFWIEYSQNEFTGRIEVYADLDGQDQLSLEVEIFESSRK